MGNSTAKTGRKRGRPAKPLDTLLGCYVGIRYGEKLRRRIEKFLGRDASLTEAAAWRLAMDGFLKSEGC